MQAVSVTMNVVSVNPANDEVKYPLKHYVINFVSGLRQVSGFPQVHRFPPPIKLIATI